MNAEQTDDLNKNFDYYFYSEADVPEFIPDDVEEIVTWAPTTFVL